MVPNRPSSDQDSVEATPTLLCRNERGNASRHPDGRGRWKGLRPWFHTSPGEEWLVVSGHTWDNGNDGYYENVIAGELDWVWTAPSS
jgi:hypothetical protein